MAEQRHTAAFIVGAILGGLAGAGVTLWTTPKSGAQLRAELAMAVESAFFRLMEVGERPRTHGNATEPVPSVPPASQAGDVRVPAKWVEPGPRVFPPLVDFAPPGVDVESPTEPTDEGPSSRAS